MTKPAKKALQPQSSVHDAHEVLSCIPAMAHSVCIMTDKGEVVITGSAAGAIAKVVLKAVKNKLSPKKPKNAVRRAYFHSEKVISVATTSDGDKLYMFAAGNIDVRIESETDRKGGYKHDMLCRVFVSSLAARRACNKYFAEKLVWDYPPSRICVNGDDTPKASSVTP
ncbi:hypothetical protein ACYPKM_01950 [Pseudomonas aeruginosa]